MKTYEKMAQNALERIEDYKAKQEKQRKTAAKIAVPAVSFCLAAIVGIGVWQTGSLSGIFQNIIGSTESGDHNHTASAVLNGTEKTNSHDEGGKVPVVRGDGESQKGADNGTMDASIIWWKNKLSMGATLYEAIKNNPGSEFAVTAVYRPATANISSFTYEGKTLADLAIAADDERMLPEKMGELLKLGESLKYGTALYQTEIPSVEKWSQWFYEERVAYFGEELLGKYIVNGTFLRDSLEKDIAAYNENSAREKYKRAYIAYMETVLPQAEKQLSEKNIKCERTEYRNGSLTIFVTEEELENLPLEDLENWSFDLAGDDLKGIVTDAAVNTDDCIIVS